MRAFLCASPLLDTLTIDWRGFDSDDKLTDSRDCPTSQVPVLYVNDEVQPIVETFAISETLAELGGLQWPTNRHDRAVSRSMCLEFQANSSALRKAIPMDLSSDAEILKPHVDLLRWIERLDAQLIASFGEFLFGELTIADAWFSPVIARAVRSDCLHSDTLISYLNSLKSTQGWKAWMQYVDRPNEIYSC
jgi:glutathione S-transferase